MARVDAVAFALIIEDEEEEEEEEENIGELLRRSRMA
jgi:hypothetical protein